MSNADLSGGAIAIPFCVIRSRSPKVKQISREVLYIIKERGFDVRKFQRGSDFWISFAERKRAREQKRGDPAAWILRDAIRFFYFVSGESLRPGYRLV